MALPAAPSLQQSRGPLEAASSTWPSIILSKFGMSHTITPPAWIEISGGMVRIGRDRIDALFKTDFDYNSLDFTGTVSRRNLAKLSQTGPSHQVDTRFEVRDGKNTMQMGLGFGWVRLPSGMGSGEHLSTANRLADSALRRQRSFPKASLQDEPRSDS